jgi:hypothetical protein
MEISIKRLTQLSRTNARAKVMINQWYPDLLKDDDVIDTPQTPIESIEVPQGMTLGNALRWYDTRLESVTDTTRVDLQLGKWYTDGQGYLMIFTGNTSNCIGFFGSSWSRNWVFSHITSSRLATEQEIGDALRRYCIEDGYTPNNFASLSSDCIYRDCAIEDWYYDYEADTLYSSTEGNGGYVVYRDGNWAPRTNSRIAF